MADRLYLSLWYPNFRLQSLPAALAGVLRQFASVGGQTCRRGLRLSHQLHRAAHLPAHLRRHRAPNPSIPAPQSIPPPHRDDHRSRRRRGHRAAPRRHGLRVRDALAALGPRGARAQLQPPWPRLQPRRRTTPTPISTPAPPTPPDTPGGCAPTPSASSASAPTSTSPDTSRTATSWSTSASTRPGSPLPWRPCEDEALDEEAQIHIQQNVEKLLAFTLLVEKNCGISSRLLWTESGEPLAEKLIARLQRVH